GRLQEIAFPVVTQNVRNEIGSPLVNDDEENAFLSHGAPTCAGLFEPRLFQRDDHFFKVP
ncbi:hypothetical protein, partial [Rhizobium leguminosarum]|uniref:hypothetical protein n=1 Tax=Rhizobium leguminosarum TaxID=384 RepID=UPI001C969991